MSNTRSQKSCKSPTRLAQRPLTRRLSYKFRQDSDFWYLTGFEEAGSALIMEKDGSARGYCMTLFHSPSTPSTAQWDGIRTSAEDVVRVFLADNARPIDEFPETLRRVLGETDDVYVDLPPGGGAKRSRSASAKSLLKVRGQCRWLDRKTNVASAVPVQDITGA